MRALALVVAALLAGTAPLTAQDSLVTRARSLVLAGAHQEAADLFRLALRQAPNNAALLGETVDALEACGQWQAAVPFLDQLLALTPDDPRRLRQRGLFAAWAGDRPMALARLRAALALRPDDPDQIVALADVLSWEPSGRAEAATLFARGLAASPSHLPLLLGHADLLSWSAGTRGQAAVKYAEALVIEPNSLRARVGQANLRAWGGDPAGALPLYDQALRLAPTDLAALRGRGGALNQLGRYQVARRVLRQAHEVSRSDVGTIQELATAELALSNPLAARRVLDRAPARSMPVIETLRDSTRRALSSSIEVGVSATSRQRQLDHQSGHLRLTLAPAVPVRVHLSAEPGRYREVGTQRRGDAFGAGLSVATPQLRAAMSARVRTLAGVDESQWDGGGLVGWSPSRRVSLTAGWQRRPVEESRLSTFGGEVDGEMHGPVHSDLASGLVEVRDILGRFDAKGEVVLGAYTGRGLQQNERLSGGFEAGATLRRSGPWLRVGYATQATQYQFNAELAEGTPAAQVGGYFSPRRHFLHQGVLQLSQRIGGRLLLEVDGRLGAQYVRAHAGQPLDDRLAAAVNTHLSWRVTSGLDLDLRYLYLDAFDAFRMHQVRLLVRQMFP